MLPAIQKVNSSPTMQLFSGINCVLFREAGVTGFLSIFGRGSLERGTENLCMLALPDVPA